MLHSTEGTYEAQTIQNQWGFLKNIVNIDRFFSSGAEDTDTGKKDKKKSAANQIDKEEAE